MKLKVAWQVSLKIKEAMEQVNKASILGMRDTVVEIHNESTKLVRVKTGHNKRSITSEVSTMGTVRKGSDSKPERVVDNSKVEGAIYSTSGYGGYLETGTARMDPRPYIKPSFDMHGKNLANNIKAHLG